MNSSRRSTINILFVLFLGILIMTACAPSTGFDGQRALGYIEKQLSFGYRIPGSKASLETSIHIREILEDNGWEVEFQDFVYEGIQIRNIIASNNSESPHLIIGAHYDTRRFSDQEDTDQARLSPVPGANDGASGVAVLLELSNHLNNFDRSIQLVFFDAEDQGRINGWPWSLGAEYFVGSLKFLPDEVVIVDMVGDKDLNIYLEENSDSDISSEIWSKAKDLGFANVFIDQPKYSLIDDHLPFIKLGIPSVLLIDFDFPHWHTNEDTLDKVSGQSLKTVGEVLLKWISDSP